MSYNENKKALDFNFFKSKNYSFFLKFYIKFNKKKIKEKHNICFFNKRKRSFIRFFGLNRNSLKDLFSEEVLPGVIKSSW